MSTVYQTNKQTGITYAYESKSYWDKNKKQSRATRKCIGKVDKLTNEIVPTRKSKKADEVIISKETTVINSTRKFCGATYLLDEIGVNTGVVDDLKTCFPDSFKQILSIAYYLILEDKNPLYRFPKWSAIHKHPFEKNIPSQRSSDIFSSITEDAKNHFFSLQAKRRLEEEFWAYDTTSISSYSECLKQAKYGVNKEDDKLPQLNLALVFGETSNLPFYYRKLAGNISDVTAVENLIKDMEFLGIIKPKLVMDRGFYSKKNIDDLYINHYKFLTSSKISLAYVQKELAAVRETIKNFNNYSEKYDLYSETKIINWEYEGKSKAKPIIKRRLYMHFYFNAQKALEEEKALNSRLSRLKSEIETGEKQEKNESQYVKYFDITTNINKVTKATLKQEVFEETKKNYGYFVLLTNEIKDSTKAIEIYRNKDVVEKAFGDLKERLDFRRPGVSSNQNLDGKIFVEFIALIFLSYLKKKMQDNNLFKKYTLSQILDELDVIESYENPNMKTHFSEVTKNQSFLYENFGVKSISSLQ